MREIVRFWPVLALGCLVGLHFWYQKSENPCEMSYMRPYYKTIADSLEGEDLDGVCRLSTPYLRRYKLLEYLEGGRVANTMDAGFALLFVPGNLGSYMQVRSLGSHLSKGVRVFTLDLLEEPSAFRGSILRDHACAVLASKKILDDMFSGGDMELRTVGHSMGGVAVELAHRMRSENDGGMDWTHRVGISSPYLELPLLGDLEMVVMSRLMKEVGEKGLISVSTGGRDGQVVHWKTKGGVWLEADKLLGFSVDHNAALWCRQLVVEVVELVKNPDVEILRWETQITTTKQYMESSMQIVAGMATECLLLLLPMIPMMCFLAEMEEEVWMYWGLGIRVVCFWGGGLEIVAMAIAFYLAKLLKIFKPRKPFVSFSVAPLLILAPIILQFFKVDPIQSLPIAFTIYFLSANHLFSTLPAAILSFLAFLRHPTSFLPIFSLYPLAILTYPQTPTKSRNRILTIAILVLAISFLSTPALTPFVALINVLV